MPTRLRMLLWYNEGIEQYQGTQIQPDAKADKTRAKALP